MQARSFKFVTDTSTLCVFDLVALRHRIDDDADWWCWPPEVQLKELNAGNVAFIDLGRDGEHSGSVSAERSGHSDFQVILSCPSGCLFIGAGEEATAEGMQPACARGGLFHPIAPGAVLLQICRSAEGQIHLAITSHAGPVANAFTSPLQLRPPTP